MTGRHAQGPQWMLLELVETPAAFWFQPAGVHLPRAPPFPEALLFPLPSTNNKHPTTWAHGNVSLLFTPRDEASVEPTPACEMDTRARESCTRLPCWCSLNRQGEKGHDPPSKERLRHLLQIHAARWNDWVQEQPWCKWYLSLRRSLKWNTQ